MPFLFWLPMIVMRGMWGIAEDHPNSDTPDR